MSRRQPERKAAQGSRLKPIRLDCSSSSESEEDRDASPRPPQIPPPSPEFGLNDEIARLEELEEPNLPYNQEYKALMDSVQEFCKEAERNPDQKWIQDVLTGLLDQMERKFPPAAPVKQARFMVLETDSDDEYLERE